VTPSAVHAAIWTAIVILYAQGWSRLLIARRPEVLIGVLLLIVLPFVIGNGIGRVLQVRTRVPLRLPRYSSAVLLLASSWWLLSAAEVWLYGGVPLVWLLQGDLTRDYTTFGIPTLHGLANGVMFAVAASSIDLFFTKGRFRWLLLHLSFYFWGVLLLSRQNLVVLAVSAGFVFVSRKGRSAVLAAVAGLAAVVLGFGFLGDLRSGRELFLSVSEIGPGPPDHLPSSVLWVYMYLVTPLNNLLYNLLDQPSGAFAANGIGFLAPLLPSILRRRLLNPVEWNPAELPFEFTGRMVTQNYNVSTGFIGAVLDLGLMGVAVSALLYGWLSGFFWRKRWRLARSCLLVMITLNSFAPSFTSLPLVAFLSMAAVLDATRLREDESGTAVPELGR
jgi:oligosaccharide repeat unit polymerase